MVCIWILEIRSINHLLSLLFLSSLNFLLRWYVSVFFASKVACRFSDILCLPNASLLKPWGFSNDSWLAYVASVHWTVVWDEVSAHGSADLSPPLLLFALLEDLPSGSWSVRFSGAVGGGGVGLFVMWTFILWWIII